MNPRVELPIETPRLLLRPFGPEDAPRIHPVFREPAVWEFVGRRPCASLADTRERLHLYADTQERHGFSFWAVALKDSGRVIGHCGLVPLLWRGPEIEVGYRLDPTLWGNGFTTEAAAAWVRAGFEALQLDRIIGRAWPENAASRRVLEKLGLEYEGVGIREDRRSVVYGLSRTGWQRRRALDCWRVIEPDAVTTHGGDGRPRGRFRGLLSAVVKRPQRGGSNAPSAVV